MIQHALVPLLLLLPLCTSFMFIKTGYSPLGIPLTKRKEGDHLVSSQIEASKIRSPEAVYLVQKKVQIRPQSFIFLCTPW